MVIDARLLSLLCALWLAGCAHRSLTRAQVGTGMIVAGAAVLVIGALVASGCDDGGAQGTPRCDPSQADVRAGAGVAAAGAALAGAGFALRGRRLSPPPPPTPGWSLTQRGAIAPRAALRARALPSPGH